MESSEYKAFMSDAICKTKFGLSSNNGAVCTNDTMQYWVADFNIIKLNWNYDSYSSYFIGM